MAISLSKGQTVSLAKPGGGLDRLHFGLGWDPVKKTGFFGRLTGGGAGDIDLDASCILFDAARTGLDVVWFKQLRSQDGSIVHSGDNLTGEGDGDDEVIRIQTSALPANIAHLVFTVNSFRGQTFDEVDNAVCRVVDEATGAELCRYTLNEKGKHTGVVMGVLSKSGDAWTFKAVGAPTAGRTAAEMTDAAVRHI